MREIEGWTEELARLQELMPLQKKIEDLKTHEISTLETQVKKLNEEIAEGARKAQEVSDLLVPACQTHFWLRQTMRSVL